MVLTSDQQRVKTLLTETITLLCKNGLQFTDELHVEALIGITVDKDEVFLVSLNEILYPGAIPIPGSSPAKSHLQLAKGKSMQKTVACNRDRIVSSTNVPVNAGEKGSGSKKLAGPSNSEQVDCATKSAVNRGKNVPAKDDEPLSKKRRSSQALDDSQLVSAICNSLLAEQKTRKIKSELTAADSDKEDDDESSSTTLLQDDDNETEDNVEREFLEQDSDGGGGNDSLCPLDMAVDAGDVLNLSGQQSSRTRRQTSNTRVKVAQCQTDDTVVAKSKTTKTDHQCPECGKLFTSAATVRLHLECIHRGNYQFTCPICGKGLRSEYFLRGHLSSRHKMRKDFKCPVCPREFGYKASLKDHMFTQHPWEAAERYPSKSK